MYASILFIDSLDQKIADFFLFHQNPFFTRLFSFLTFLANPEVILSLLCVMILVMHILHRRQALTTFFEGIGLAAVLAFVIKQLIYRPRPLIHTLSLTYSDSSFPSAHTLVGTVCYGIIGAYLYQKARSFWARLGAFAVMVLVPLGIGLSRMYLGYHWFSDVLVGWSIGGLIAWALISHVSHAQEYIEDHHQSAAKIHSLLFLIVVAEMLLVFGFYFLFITGM